MKCIRNKKIKDTGTISSGDIDDEDETDHLLNKSKFPGWISFLLWGPFASKRDRLSVFCTNDNENLKRSRRHQREEELKQKKIEYIL